MHYLQRLKALTICLPWSAHSCSFLLPFPGHHIYSQECSTHEHAHSKFLQSQLQYICASNSQSRQKGSLVWVQNWKTKLKTDKNKSNFICQRAKFFLQVTGAETMIYGGQA